MSRSYFVPGNLTTRFLCYYGYTGDLFVDEMLYPHNMEFALHRQLKAAGYERVVFYGYSKGAYFLDEESQSLWHGKKEKKKQSNTKNLFGNAPKLKGKLTAQAAPDSQNRGPMSFNVGASEMLRFAENFLRDTSIRTAVVFPNGVEAMKEFAALDQGKLLDNFFVRVTENSVSQADNSNTAIFVFNRTLAQMESLLSERARESLNNYLRVAGNATWHHVGLPGKAEVRRLLNYLRLWGDGEKRLMVDCSQLEEISGLLARTMAANCARTEEEKVDDPALLQTWLLNDTFIFLKNRFLQPEKPLTLESCREFCKRGGEAPALERLEALVGMGKVKESVRAFVAHAAKHKTQPQQEAQSRLDREPLPPKKEVVNVHFTITGSQGTGKTTAAKLIGEILYEAGLLATGQTVMTTPGELLKGGQYSGQIQQNLIQEMERAMGGVLFIDEAYDLMKPEAEGIVTQLLTEMENRKGSVSVILAGYRDRIEELLDPKKGANPGLKRRFGNQILHIEDYTVEELGQILRMKAKARGKILSEELEELLPTFLHNWYYDKKRSGWGNAGEMENLLQAMTLGKEDSSVLDVSMIPEEYVQYVTAKEEKDALVAVEAMVGLRQVKEEIQKMRRRRKNGRSTGIPHFLFAGPPGTGKTTVGGHMGKILKNMGVLKSGHLVEVKPKDMEAGYVGQTADKAREFFENAKDGVLFIDEAYGMIPKDKDFKEEIINTLLEYTDPNEKKGPLCVICAGYEKDLKELLSCNEGLARRFKTWIHFESYSPQELMQILQQTLDKEGFHAEEGYLAAAAQDFTENIETIACRYNGGYIKIYLDASVDLLDERLERIYGNDPVPEKEKQILTAEDAPESGSLLK